MIKLFKNKMLIALFLLVIGISVTSSCYAINIVKNSDGLALNGFNRDAVQDFLIKNGYSDYATGKYFLVRDFNSETSSYHAFVFDSSQISYLGENSSTELCINFFNNNNERIKANYVWLEFDCVANSFVFKSVSEDVYNFYLFKTSQEIIYSDFDLYDQSNNLVGMSFFTYDDFEWSIDNVNNTLTITNIPLSITQTFNLNVDISNYSDYIVAYNDYNRYQVLYDQYYTFGIMLLNDYDWEHYSYGNHDTYYIYNINAIFCHIEFSVSNSNYKFSFSNSNSFTAETYQYMLRVRSDFWICLEYGNLSEDYRPYCRVADSSFDEIINPVDGSVLWSLSNVNINTNFNYKFVAESKNKLALTITDLDSSYKMIGFVNNPTKYEVGDVLSAGIDIGYQRITPRRFR